MKSTTKAKNSGKSNQKQFHHVKLANRPKKVKENKLLNFMTCTVRKQNSFKTILMKSQNLSSQIYRFSK